MTYRHPRESGDLRSQGRHVVATATPPVIPAKAGISGVEGCARPPEIPASAGMTNG